DEECIARVTNLLSYGVGRNACRVVGVVWREWNEWKHRNLHGLEQQLAFGKLCQINAMHDEIMEIIDDDEKKWFIDSATGRGKEVDLEEIVLTPRERSLQSPRRASPR